MQDQGEGRYIIYARFWVQTPITIKKNIYLIRSTKHEASHGSCFFSKLFDSFFFLLFFFSFYLLESFSMFIVSQIFYLLNFLQFMPSTINFYRKIIIVNYSQQINRHSSSDSPTNKKTLLKKQKIFIKKKKKKKLKSHCLTLNLGNNYWDV